MSSEEYEQLGRAAYEAAYDESTIPAIPWHNLTTTARSAYCKQAAAVRRQVIAQLTSDSAIHDLMFAARCSGDALRAAIIGDEPRLGATVRTCQAHCCKRHGCKYGYDDCPVTLGVVKQDGPCESCGDDVPEQRLADEVKQLSSTVSSLSDAMHAVQKRLEVLEEKRR